MQLGMSSYSLHQAVLKKEMTFLETISWAKTNGADHFEVVPLDFDLAENPEMTEKIKKTAEIAGIPLSNYAIAANFVCSSEQKLNEEIERVKKHVDIADQLGVKCMRHDAASRPLHQCDILHFNSDLPQLVKACGEIADYAARYGITTSVENHGYYMQESDRVKMLVELTDRDNFRTTLDVGNFLCCDEDPVTSVANNVGIASYIHIKDFHYRPIGDDPGAGWFPTKQGAYLKGAIAGQGDIDLKQVLKVIKKSGYDGYFSLEFEGSEDCREGAAIGLKEIKERWQQV